MNKKRNHKLIQTYNYHIPRQIGLKRYVNFLSKYIIAFNIQSKEENRYNSFTLWNDIYEKGIWNIKRTSEIRRYFREEFKIGCYSKMQPKRVVVYKTQTKCLIVIKMNYELELEQIDEDNYREYTFIYVMLNKGIIELLKGSDDILKD
nr:MAG TPA: hypothetical protein [Ackermannviridae sp.]